MPLISPLMPVPQELLRTVSEKNLQTRYHSYYDVKVYINNELHDTENQYIENKKLS